MLEGCVDGLQGLLSLRLESVTEQASVDIFGQLRFVRASLRFRERLCARDILVKFRLSFVRHSAFRLDRELCLLPESLLLPRAFLLHGDSFGVSFSRRFVFRRHSFACEFVLVLRELSLLLVLLLHRLSLFLPLHFLSLDVELRLCRGVLRLFGFFFLFPRFFLLLCNIENFLGVWRVCDFTQSLRPPLERLGVERRRCILT